MEISRPDFSRIVDGGQELITAVIQDNKTQHVLDVLLMSRDALMKTLNCNRVAYSLPSDKEIRFYGETDGDFLEVVDVRMSRNGRSILIFVNPVGSDEAGYVGPRTNFQQPFFIEGGTNESASEKGDGVVVKWVDWPMEKSLR